MANYEEIFNSKLDWAMPFQRTGKFPLDRTDLFSSYDDAVKYAAGNTEDPDSRELCGTSYVGQTITVFENDVVTFYQIQADRTIKQVGSSSSLEDITRLQDEFNFKLYGTTDVYILTEDDVLIEDNIITAQKVSIIKHDVVIIPEGITDIRADGTYYDEESGNDAFIEGIYPINIKAKKIICPSTLKTIIGTNGSSSAIHDICLDKELVLNEGLTTISLDNIANASGGFIGNIITLPSTIEHFDAYESFSKLIIPKDVESIYFSIKSNNNESIYVYNPNMDFSNFNIGGLDVYYSEEINVTFYGYAGSTTEIFAKENRCNFVNIGSSESIQNCIGYGYGFKILDVKLCDENDPLPSNITPEDGVNYGYYKLKSYINPEELEGQKYCVVIKTNQTYPGVWDKGNRKWIYGTIVYVNGYKVYVSYIPVNDDGTVLGLNSDVEVPENGDINNYLLIPDYPELGDTLVGYFTHIEGQGNNALARVAHVEGRDNKVVGKYGHAEGRKNAVGYCAHGEGNNNLVLADSSHGEGSNNIIKGNNGHGEGAGNYVSGSYAHGEGINNNAIGRASHVQGELNSASGHASHAGGLVSYAFGTASTAQGSNLRAWGKNTTEFGHYNDYAEDWNTNEEEYSRFALVVGNGKSEDTRSNALTLDWDGNLEVQTSVKTPCAILISPDGSEFKLKVANDGTLSAERV